MKKLSTGDMGNYMRARARDNHVIDAPANDPVLLQAAQDGYADRVNGQWIVRGHIKPGERRIVRYTYGGTTEVIG